MLDCKGITHRVIMYFVHRDQGNKSSCLPYFGHLPVNSCLSVVYIAAVATELGGIKIHTFQQDLFHFKM
jgi:hypothetical protein